MRKKQEIEQFCASQEVIRNYIDYVKLQGGNPKLSPLSRTF